MFGNQMRLTPIQGTDLSRLPSEADSDPLGGCLDAQCGWRNFGGLTLEDAYAKFCEVPERLQEDFMFMGCRAFHFYFPVIDEYLKIATSTGEWHDCQVRVLAECIALQFDWRGATISPELRDRISQLCTFVRAHLDRYTELPEDQKEIDLAWVTVEGIL